MFVSFVLPEALCGLFVKSTLSLNLTWHVLSGEIAADETLDLQIKHPLSGLSGAILYSYPISILLAISKMVQQWIRAAVLQPVTTP